MVSPFGETLFVPNIFAFIDFGIFMYSGPRPTGEFGVQHAIELEKMFSVKSSAHTSFVYQ